MRGPLRSGRVTLAIVKPDAHRQGSTRNIVDMLSRQGFQIVRDGGLRNLSRSEGEEFYKDHRGKFFYQRLVSFMTSGPVQPLVLCKDNAISDWRALMGPTHIERSRSEAKGSIRGMFAASDTRNCVHGSGDFVHECLLVRTHVDQVQDSPETAEREIRFFFPEFQMGMLN